MPPLVKPSKDRGSEPPRHHQNDNYDQNDADGTNPAAPVPSGVSITAMNATAMAPRLEMPGRQDADFCGCAVQERRISAAVTMNVRVSRNRLVLAFLLAPLLPAAIYVARPSLSGVSLRFPRTHPR